MENDGSCLSRSQFLASLSITAQIHLPQRLYYFPDEISLYLFSIRREREPNHCNIQVLFLPPHTLSSLIKHFSRFLDITQYINIRSYYITPYWELSFLLFFLNDRKKLSGWYIGMTSQKESFWFFSFLLLIMCHQFKGILNLL